MSASFDQPLDSSAPSDPGWTGPATESAILSAPEEIVTPVEPAAPVEPLFEPRPTEAAAESQQSSGTEPEPAPSLAPERTATDSWSRPVSTVPSTSRPARPGRAGGLGEIILVTSLLSALLASGGTYEFLQLSGSLNSPAPVALANPSPNTLPTLGITPPTSPLPGASAASPAVAAAPSSLVAMLARVSPAIVTITSSTTTPAPVPGSLLGGTPVTDIGSGIIFDSAGWIITNHHVVSGSGKLLVTTADGRQFAGTIYGIDTLTDLAIVKIDATGLPTATIGDSSTLAVGQSVVAIGDPEGVYPNSVTAGIVSALGRTIQVEDGSYLRDLIQTDAAINPGNSGGALLDAAGNVVGIPSATAGGAEGLGFAIPINLARPIMAQALAGQKLARPYMGIRYLSLTPQIAADAKLSVSQGAWLQPASADTSGLTGPAVTPGSPAATAGLQDNDVITAVNGVSIDAAHTLDDLLLQYAPGTSLNLAVSRGDTTITLHLTLGTRPAGL